MNNEQMNRGESIILWDREIFGRSGGKGIAIHSIAYLHTERKEIELIDIRSDRGTSKEIVAVPDHVIERSSALDYLRENGYFVFD